MRNHWSPWRAAIWGAGVGICVAVVQLVSPGGTSLSDAQPLGQITGSIITGSVLFGLGAAIRNWVVGSRSASDISTLAHETGQRRGIPDWLVIPLGVLLGELHRLILAPLLAGMAMIALVGRR